MLNFHYFMQVLQGEYDLCDVDPHFIFGEFLPLVEMRE